MVAVRVGEAVTGRNGRTRFTGLPHCKCVYYAIVKRGGMQDRRDEAVAVTDQQAVHTLERLEHTHLLLHKNSPIRSGLSERLRTEMLWVVEPCMILYDSQKCVWRQRTSC